MKRQIKSIILLVVLMLTLTGCARNLRDAEGVPVINPETGQRLPANILCRPTEQDLLDLYEKHAAELEFSMEDLPRCENMKLYDSTTYSGLWNQIFVIPLAWYIVRVALLVGNFGIAVMLVGLMIRVIMTPLSLKTMKQSQNMKKAQADLAGLEKKYKDKKDNESMMKKSQEMMMIYKKHNVSPISSCLNSFLQLPIFLAFLAAINRTPAIFEETLWSFQLGTTPWVGIQSGNYLYILLIALIIGTTYLSFKFNMNTMGNQDQQKQMKFMLNFMLVFISIASFSLPTAIALYWITTNGFNVVQNLIIKKWGKK